MLALSVQFQDFQALLGNIHVCGKHECLTTLVEVYQEQTHSLGTNEHYELRLPADNRLISGLDCLTYNVSGTANLL